MPGLTGTHIDLDVIPDGQTLHDTLQIMIAVLTLAQNIQGQIHLGKSAFVKGGHLIRRPSM